MQILRHSPKLCIDFFALLDNKEKIYPVQSRLILFTASFTRSFISERSFSASKRLNRISSSSLHLFYKFMMLTGTPLCCIVSNFNFFSCILHFQSCILKGSMFWAKQCFLCSSCIICLDTKSRFIVHSDSTRGRRVLSTFFCLFVCCCIEFVSEHKLPITSQVHTQGRECTQAGSLYFNVSFMPILYIGCTRCSRTIKICCYLNKLCQIDEQCYAHTSDLDIHRFTWNIIDSSRVQKRLNMISI